MRYDFGIGDKRIYAALTNVVLADLGYDTGVDFMGERHMLCGASGTRNLIKS